ncbi:hypothetical protein RUA4292_03377 [Ruegeria atlantica]|uniref:Uncharacterized protein n=1 Tax=Ruegeria atlantica TaxID=81569 RepID=A0A0P1F0E7_9RHOB|nr:hypothetical protein RUA4292_03377 [Ruegeria atlantica]
MILFNHVVQIYGSDCSNFGLAAKPNKDLICFLNARRGDSTSINEDFVWNSFTRQRFHKEPSWCWAVSALKQYEINGVSSFVGCPMEVLTIAAKTLQRNRDAFHTNKTIHYQTPEANG